MKEKKMILVEKGGRTDFNCGKCGGLIRKKEPHQRDSKFVRYHLICPEGVKTETETETKVEAESETEKSEEPEDPEKPIFDCTGIKEGDKVVFNEDGTKTIK